jgi:hypothetical protein
MRTLLSIGKYKKIKNIKSFRIGSFLKPNIVRSFFFVKAVFFANSGFL